MNRTIWSLPSLRDTRRIFDALEIIDPAAARRVIDAIEASVERLEAFPLSAPAAGSGRIRKLSIPRYPYLVFYRFRSRTITVTRVRHAHEDWRPR